MDAEFGMLLVLFGVMGAIVLFVFNHALQQARSLDDVYDHVASHLGGESIPGGFMGRPWIRFRWQGAPAKIDIHSTGGKHPRLYTQLHLMWPDRQLRCDITPQQLLHRMGKMLGMQDIEVGTREFDDRYLIRGNSERAIRHLLNADVQVAVESLRRFLGNNDISISILSGRLVIRKRSLIRDRETLERFVRMGTHLHEVALKTEAEGIEFIGAEQQEATLSLSSAVCQVCGDEVALDAVFCRSCKTPHHQDCWRYYGSCSTYGCGETRFLVARKKGAANRRRDAAS